MLVEEHQGPEGLKAETQQDRLAHKLQLLCPVAIRQETRILRIKKLASSRRGTQMKVEAQLQQRIQGKKNRKRATGQSSHRKIFVY